MQNTNLREMICLGVPRVRICNRSDLESLPVIE